MPTAITTAPSSKNLPRVEAFSPSLNDRFQVAPMDLFTSYNRWATVWSVAQAVSTVSLLAIGAASLAFITAWNPETVFYFSVALTVVLPIFSTVTSFFEEKIAHYHSQAEKFGQIAKIHRELLEKKPRELESKFDRYGITRQSIQNFKNIDGGFQKLAAGLAYFIYTNNMTMAMHKKMEEFTGKARKETDLGKKRSYAHQAFVYDQARVVSRMHAAYDLACLRNPFSKKTLDDVGSIQEREPQNILLDRYYAESDALFLFHDNKKKPATFTELGRSVQDLIANPQGGGATALRDISKRLFV